MTRIKYERKYMDSLEFCSRMVESWGNIKQNSRYRQFYTNDIDSVIKHIQNFAMANTKNTVSIDINKDLLVLKLALFKLIDQFGYELVDNKGNEYFDTLCESALENAFSILGFEGNLILKEIFYHEFDVVKDEYEKLTDKHSSLSYEETYILDKVDRNESRYVKVYLDDHDIDRIKSKYNISNQMNIQTLDFEEVIYDLINKALDE